MTDTNLRKDAFFRSITPLIPFFGAFMILYGAINAITYYLFFSINIIEFITFTELITYFIKDVYQVITNLLILSFAAYIMTRLNNNFQSSAKKLSEQMDTLLKMSDGDIKALKDSGNAQELIDRFKTDVNKHKKKFRNVKYGVKIGLVCTGIYILVTVVMTRSWFLLMTVALFSLIMVLIIKSFKIDFRIYFIILFFVDLIFCGFSNAFIQYRHVYKGKNVGVVFKVDGKEFISDSTDYFIGKTEKYIFYYQSRIKQTRIFPSEKIEFITIPDKPWDKSSILQLLQLP